MTFIARMASATSTAMPSELTRNVLPSPSKPIGRDDRDDPLVQEKVQRLRIHPLDAAGVRKSTPPRMPAGCAMMELA